MAKTPQEEAEEYLIRTQWGLNLSNSPSNKVILNWKQRGIVKKAIQIALSSQQKKHDEEIKELKKGMNINVNLVLELSNKYNDLKQQNQKLQKEIKKEIPRARGEGWDICMKEFRKVDSEKILKLQAEQDKKVEWLKKKVNLYAINEKQEFTMVGIWSLIDEAFKDGGK